MHIYKYKYIPIFENIDIYLAPYWVFLLFISSLNRGVPIIYGTGECRLFAINKIISISDGYDMTTCTSHSMINDHHLMRMKTPNKREVESIFRVLYSNILRPLGEVILYWITKKNIRKSKHSYSYLYSLMYIYTYSDV